MLAYPPATFLYRAIPDVAALGSAGLILLRRDRRALVWLSMKTGKNPLAPAVLLIGLTIVILVVDVATGNRLQLSSLLGLSLNSAGRYYGFGNISLALLAAGSIMLTVILIDASTSKREVAIVGSMFLVFILLVDGAPMLGNDIGGILTLAPVFTVVIARLLGLRLTWKTVIVGGSWPRWARWCSRRRPTSSAPATRTGTSASSSTRSATRAGRRSPTRSCASSARSVASCRTRSGPGSSRSAPPTSRSCCCGGTGGAACSSASRCSASASSPASRPACSARSSTTPARS